MINLIAKFQYRREPMKNKTLFSFSLLFLYEYNDVKHLPRPASYILVLTLTQLTQDFL